MWMCAKAAGRATALGYEVLFDDRDERAGIKFNDADLIGLPVQVIIGGKTLKEGLVELKRRSDGDVRKVTVNEIDAVLTEWLGPFAGP